MNGLPDFDALTASIRALEATIDYQEADLGLLATKYGTVDTAV